MVALSEALAGVRAVLFDKDGTLLDFDATWGPATAAVLAALSGGDPGVAAKLAADAGFLPDSLSFAPGSPIIAGSMDDFAPLWAAGLGRPYDADFAASLDRLYRDASLAALTAYADCAPVLARLRAAGYRIGLATNDAEATARAHLTALGLLGSFDFVAGYDSGFGAKPAPGMVAAFAAATGLPACAVALVGDAPHDMETARAAGAVPVGIARTPRAAAALGADASITNLDALAEALLVGDPAVT